VSDGYELERNLEIARKALDGAAGKSAQGAENKYGIAYAQLVRVGLRPKLKKKYRTKG
jgi:hypothetical protein